MACHTLQIESFLSLFNYLFLPSGAVLLSAEVDPRGVFALTTVPLALGLVCCCMSLQTLEEPTQPLHASEYATVMYQTLWNADAAKMITVGMLFFSVPVVSLNVTGPVFYYMQHPTNGMGIPKGVSGWTHRVRTNMPCSCSLFFFFSLYARWLAYCPEDPFLYGAVPVAP